jgi:hypothetical protein
MLFLLACAAIGTFAGGMCGLIAGFVLAEIYFPNIVDPIHAIWGAVGGFGGAFFGFCAGGIFGFVRAGPPRI